MNERQNRKRAAISAVLLGVGFGGFVDGIFLHQIFQWHHMLSSILPPEDLRAMKINMVWDGYFHVFVWIIALAGVFMLWHVARRPYTLPHTSWFTGLLLAGWGIFNLVEGGLNHHILEIHHVYGYNPNPVWDYGFLILCGAGFILLGWLLARRSN